MFALALHFPQVVNSVTSAVIPFIPSNSSKDPMERFLTKPGIFDYQRYFYLQEGGAEKELEKDVPTTIKTIFRRHNDKTNIKEKLIATDITERGYWLPKESHKMDDGTLLTNEERQLYISTFSKNGFRGPLNWYRNVKENWKFSNSVEGKKIEKPVLMVTVNKDFLFNLDSTLHMEAFAPRLFRANLHTSHWVQAEEPQAFNQVLEKFLHFVHNKSNL